MTQDELMKKLKYLKTKWVDFDKHSFSRVLEIDSKFGKRKIIWYPNVCTMILPDGTEVWFHDISIKTNYPSQKAKYWIELTFCGMNIGIHIPVTLRKRNNK